MKVLCHIVIGGQQQAKRTRNIESFQKITPCCGWDSRAPKSRCFPLDMSSI
jgi:hypothetical protein